MDYLIPQMMKKKRTELGMSQNAFAEHIGVHCRTVGAWEIDKCIPKSEMYPMLAKVLGVPFNEIERMCDNESANRRSNTRESRKNPQSV